MWGGRWQRWAETQSEQQAKSQKPASQRASEPESQRRRGTGAGAGAGGAISAQMDDGKARQVWACASWVAVSKRATASRSAQWSTFAAARVQMAVAGLATRSSRFADAAPATCVPFK